MYRTCRHGDAANNEWRHAIFGSASLVCVCVCVCVCALYVCVCVSVCVLCMRVMSHALLFICPVFLDSCRHLSPPSHPPHIASMSPASTSTATSTQTSAKHGSHRIYICSDRMKMHRWGQMHISHQHCCYCSTYRHMSHGRPCTHEYPHAHPHPHQQHRYPPLRVYGASHPTSVHMHSSCHSHARHM